jgi:hypothetical protein
MNACTPARCANFERATAAVCTKTVQKNSAWQNNFATSYQRNHLRAKVRCAGKGDMRVSYK